ESWSQPDETTYFFKLRKGVRWHPKPPVNGRELTAEDVVYSFERFRSVKEQSAELPPRDDGPGGGNRPLHGEGHPQRALRMVSGHRGQPNDRRDRGPRVRGKVRGSQE